MADPRLLIVEDDEAFARTLKRSFERRGYGVDVAADSDAMATLIEANIYDFAVVDLKLGQESGLLCVQRLHRHDPATRIVVLTGYASIATAVESIKLGASQYLAKPSSSDDIEAAFQKAAGDVATPIETRPTTIKTLEWEHIHEVLAQTGFNISEAARRLGMHRRTLARKLEKRQIR